MFISTLNNRKFRNFFLADIISSFGTGMSFIATSWFALEHSGSNKAVSIFLITTILSGFLIFPFAGTIADRFNRKRVLTLSNTVRGILIALVAATIFIGHFKLHYIYALAAVSGVGMTVFIPTSRGFVQEILSPEEYSNGNSLIEISMQTGMFVAGAACGFIYKYFGYPVILITDAITFFASNFFLSKINYTPTIAHDNGEKFFRQLVNGGKFLTKNPLILGFGIAMFIPFVATMTSNVVAPGYVSQHLKGDSVVFGIADMAYGVGACLSGFIAARLAGKLSNFRTIIIFFIISIASLLYLVVNNVAVGLYLSGFFFGLANYSLRIIMGTQIMEVVPKSYMGRCQSVWMASSMLLQIFSMYAVGCLIDRVPVQFGNLVLAIIMLMGFLGVLYFVPRLKFPKTADNDIEGATDLVQTT